MSDVQKVELTPAERRMFMTLGIALLIVALSYVHLAWFRFDHSYRSYSQSDLLHAKLYVDALPDSAAPTLFATNGRNFQSFGDRTVADPAIREFRRAQAATYLIGLKRVDVVVLPGFLGASRDERRQMLVEANVRTHSMTALLDAAAVPIGCVVEKYSPFDMTERAFVLADPSSPPVNSEQTVRCVTAGLLFVNGFPLPRDTFDLAKMPSARTGAIVLDYVMRCAYNGVTEIVPARRSNGGITSKPSIGCVRDKIAAAIADAAAQ